MRGIARRSKASSDAWAVRAQNGTKTHRRSQQRKQRLRVEHRLNPLIIDSIHVRHDLIREFLTSLREVPMNTYSRRVNRAKISLNQGQSTMLAKYWPPPTKTCRVTKYGRTYNSWCDMPACIRNAVFSGDLDLDIRKCHFTILNIILAQIGVKQLEFEEMIADCEAHGISRVTAKELINATIHGAGGRSCQKILGTLFSGVQDLPPTIIRLRNHRATLFLGQTLRTPFGDSIEFVEGQWFTNKRKWNTVFNLWETWLKIKLFHNLKNFEIILDIYDGVIAKVRDGRAMNSTLSEIEGRCLNLTQELRLCDVIRFSHNLL